MIILSIRFHTDEEDVLAGLMGGKALCGLGGLLLPLSAICRMLLMMVCLSTEEPAGTEEDEEEAGLLTGGCPANTCCCCPPL